MPPGTLMSDLGGIMAWGRPSGPSQRFPVTVFVGGQAVQVMVADIGNGPINEVTPWAVISTYMSGGTMTREETPEGRSIIVNWPQVQAVIY